MHSFNPSILREYDIRGVVGETLFTEDALALGRAFGSQIRRNGGSKVCVGYDGRLSSPEMADALAEGLMGSGCEVFAIGLGPTPMLYFAVQHLQADGGIMVTGSHNPPDFNGFKLSLADATVYGEAIQRLGALAAAGDFTTGAGSARKVALQDAYVARLLRDFEPGRPLTVAWDAGNGAGGEVMTQLTARLSGRHHLLFADIDGRFPNHHPDPTVPANLVVLSALVRREDCDLGIAFDGDADRIGVVDGSGEVLWGDQIMLFLASDVLRDHPGAPIIADVKASQVLFDGIRALGGEPVMWKTGHSLIKARMKELGSPFAGEMSAHLFFADRYYGYDDALYAAVRLLNILGRDGVSLAEFRRGLPAVVNTPEIRFDCDDTRKFQVVEEVRARLAAAGADVNDIDGVRVSEGSGWWLLRASNTQPVLVARCEAADQAGLALLMTKLKAELAASGVALPD